MKKLLLSILALASALLAQDVTGTWQGPIQLPAAAGGRQLRTVIKVSRADDKLKAVMYSIDQGGQPITAGEFTVQGSTIKMTVPAIGGKYEGKLSADAKSIEGTWSQGPNPLPLNLTRATAETAWTIPDPPSPPKKMKADANPVFEVATIKPSNPDSQGQGLTIQGHRMVTRNTSLSFLITFAYGLHAKQIAGAPAWLDSEKFDITAEPDLEGQPNDRQIKSMIQKLLADRFKLTFHREKKELSVYAITVAKGGPKLTRDDSDPNGLPGLGFRGKLGALGVRNATIGDFAGLMQSVVLDRPVVDQTGLTGRWDFTLDWTPEASQFGGRAGPPAAAAADDPTAPPDLFTATVRQLGLKLEGAKAPVDVLVVDHVEKPSEN
ncbi:MAG TPA: TIGR03435 family protein [Bryobacteraceae bacterium]|nr:TIGR03435 family protein [Bryobacteraceae bacterium]